MSKRPLKAVYLLLSFVAAHIVLAMRALRLSSLLVRYIRARNAGDETTTKRIQTDAIIWAVYVVTTNLPWLNTCLTRSLTAVSLLRAFGIPSKLQIGVRKINDCIEAHAWVTNGANEVVCDKVTDLDTYAKLETTAKVTRLTGWQ